MYRILDAAEEVRERRAQARHPAYAKPELVATAPNQIWSWDITKLKGPIPYLYYSLYVILDLFSRYVVGWMVAAHENAHLAQRLIEATCRKQHIGPQQLTIHADRGAPMRSKLVALLFSDLGIEASHSRPRVSNDNPFSEAQFRTVKYRPDFPDRFGSIEHARAIGHDLFAWYNDAHHHSGLSYLTPADVHYGRAATILEVRHHTRLAAYAAVVTPECEQDLVLHHTHHEVVDRLAVGDGDKADVTANRIRVAKAPPYSVTAVARGSSSDRVVRPVSSPSGNSRRTGSQ